MIAYTEKGAGLHEAISHAGHWLRESDRVWLSSNEAAVQAIINSYSLDDAKAYQAAQVLAHAKMLRDKVVSAVSAGEMARWSIKLDEAKKFTASGNSTDCPGLVQEAQYRQIPIAALVAKVMANASRLQAVEAAISGIDGRHRDAIMALTSFEAVAKYNFTTGWPEV